MAVKTNGSSVAEDQSAVEQKPRGQLRIAVIVPALNEEEALKKTLPELGRHVQQQDTVIVVDGGSIDKTVEVACSCSAQVVSAPRGRGRQMNLGAEAAKDADALLFLHADTSLPEGALDRVRNTLASTSVLGGCFQLRFLEQESSLALRFWAWCTRCWLLLWPRLAFGDRAIFVRSSTFRALSGFREMPLLEDVDFNVRLARLGGRRSFAFLPLEVTTSARRFMETGPVRQQFLNTFLWICWHLGIPAETLKGWYTYKLPGIRSS